MTVFLNSHRGEQVSVLKGEPRRLMGGSYRSITSSPYNVVELPEDPVSKTNTPHLLDRSILLVVRLRLR